MSLSSASAIFLLPLVRAIAFTHGSVPVLSRAAGGASLAVAMTAEDPDAMPRLSEMSSFDLMKWVMSQPGFKVYLEPKDVLLVERRVEDVMAFHEKERRRWLEVYEEEYRGPQDLEFYPGDRIEVVNDVKVKEGDVQGMQGTVIHYEFDDGYEACQTYIYRPAKANKTEHDSSS